MSFVQVLFSTVCVELIKPQCKLKNKCIYNRVTLCNSRRKLVWFFLAWSRTMSEKASTGQTLQHTNHVTYQQASQDHHCQAQHLLPFLLTPLYPNQAGDERKTPLNVDTNAGHFRENSHFLKLWVGYPGLSVCSTTADDDDCTCTLFELA